MQEIIDSHWNHEFALVDTPDAIEEYIHALPQLEFDNLIEAVENYEVNESVVIVVKNHLESCSEERCATAVECMVAV